MTDLDKYQGNETDGAPDHPPIVKLTTAAEAIRPPAKPGKIAGWVGRDDERGKTFVSLKDREKHYYRVGEGYALSLKIVGMLQARDVQTVVIYEMDEGRTLVFNLAQFAGGDEVEHAPDGDPQHYVPESAALEEWTDAGNPVLDVRSSGSDVGGY
jgi:hypothetical protein